MLVGMMPKAARERSVSFRARAPHSLHIREGPKSSKHFAARQAAGDEPVGREIGDDLATVLGNHHLFFDSRGAGAVLGALPGFQRVATIKWLLQP
jgi:hypothetical protein